MTGLFQRFLDAPSFTPDVLIAFLNSCYDHSEYLMTQPIAVMTSDDHKVYLADALSVAEEKNDELFMNYLFDGNDKDLTGIIH